MRQRGRRSASFAASPEIFSSGAWACNRCRTNFLAEASLEAADKFHFDYSVANEEHY